MEEYTLVVRKPCFGLPTACPSCLPVFFYLKFANVPFHLDYNLTYPDSGINAFSASSCLSFVFWEFYGWVLVGFGILVVRFFQEVLLDIWFLFVLCIEVFWGLILCIGLIIPQYMGFLLFLGCEVPNSHLLLIWSFSFKFLINYWELSLYLGFVDGVCYALAVRLGCVLLKKKGFCGFGISLNGFLCIFRQI